MRISKLKWTVSFILLLNGICGYSQPSVSLRHLAENTKANFNTNFKKAVTYANQHGIPLSQNTTEGRHLLLVDVVNNIPVYLSGLNSEAATTTGVSKLRDGMSGINLEGEGMLIGVWDEGSVKAHIELGSRVISKEVDNDLTHATHVTGTLIATGINPDAKGMAPKAEATTWYFNNDLAEMAALAKPDESSLLISNHSYGTVTGWAKINGIWSWSGDPSIGGNEDYRFGFYGYKAAAIDELANLAPYYTIVWAAGNDRGEPGDGSIPPDCNGGTGYDCIIPESVAKNNITVGAIYDIPNYSGPASVVMSNFSSWGPTDDGRIKPDLVGAGVNIFSLTATGENTYGYLSGTSMATPNVAGSLLLLQQLYRKLHGGAFMKSATLKALAIHTAKEAGVLPGPDYSFGWGVLDAEAASKLLMKEDDVNTIIRNETLENGKQFEFSISPLANQKITATLVWNDPAGTPVANALDPTTLMLVNDLDLRLVDSDGALQYPWLLDPGSPSSQAIKGDNYRDNVEKIEFSFPQAKPYRVVVSHKGQLTNGAQNFSLILTYRSAQATGNTLYWIGDSGNWNDNTHWSLSSGGTPAFTTPSASDRVIIDENSFDGLGLDQIAFTQNENCNSLKWIRSVSGSINLQGYTLTVAKEFTIGDDSFTTTGTGIIKCASASNGSLFFENSNLGSVGLRIEGGNWKVKGDVTTSQIEVVSGQLEIEDTQLKVDNLIANSPSEKKIILSQTEIALIASHLDGANLDIVANNATIKIQNTSGVLDWDNLFFDGVVNIQQANVILSGDNTIQEINLNGALEISGSNVIHTLSVSPGSEISLANTTTQSLGTVTKMTGLPSERIRILANAKASLNLMDHFLLCADYVDVTNVDVSGTMAKINLGANSVISNSTNWSSQSCESVVFADFDAAFLCAHGFTEFEDRSSGENTSWQWNFGDVTSPVNTSTAKNAYHEFSEPGTYTVQLTVSDGQQTHTYAKEIEIADNKSVENEIAVTSNELVSMEKANSYQWFFNEQKIAGATGRSYLYNGLEGLYRVVIYDEACNRSSNLVTITGLDEPDLQVNVYPNPARSELHVEQAGFSGKMYMSLTDLAGKPVWKQAAFRSATIPIKQLREGIYLLKVQSRRGELVTKVLVQP